MTAPSRFTLAARRAGLPIERSPTLADVDARRSQLWLIAFVLQLGLGAALALAPLGGAVSVPARLGLLLVAATFALYVVEKERSLRVVSHLLVEERQRVAALAEQATHDPLTGLLTMGVFKERVATALARSKRHGDPLALLIIDLDHFRSINTQHGTSAGDGVLVEVARRLRAHVRAEDAVARVRGDRFAVLLEELDGAAGADRVASRIVEALQPPVATPDGPTRITAALGIVVHQGGRKEQAADLLRDAELACRIAKRRGRNRREVFDQTASLSASA